MYWKTMAQVTITINSREYAVACEDGQEARIYQLADILDEKAQALTGGSQQVNENMLLAMVGLLLADEITELKKGGKAPETAGGQSADAARLLETDKAIAEKLKSLDEKLNLLANELNLL